MAGIIEQVKSALEITSEIERLTGKPVKGNGNTRMMDECPFCHHQGCFRVYVKEQRFVCFSSACGESGDIIDFAKISGNLAGTWEAVQELAKQNNILIKNVNGELQKSQEDARGEEIFNAAAEFYHQILLADKDAMDELFRKRKYTENEVRMFKLGYTGNDWNGLLKNLTGKYSPKDLVDAGLLADRGQGKLRDYFPPERFIYPAFIGRQVVDFEGKDAYRDKRSEEERRKIPKSLNLKVEHRLRNKLFYNQQAFNHDTIIFVEGKDDCIQMLRAKGMYEKKYNFGEESWKIPNIKMNVVAFDGNISEAQKQFIRKHCFGKTVYICPDNDEPKPGQDKESWQNPGLEYVKHIFFLTWGYAEQCQVMKVADFRAGDPDEYFSQAHGKQGFAFKKLISKSVDAFSYLLSKAVKVHADNAKQIKELEPYIEKLIGIKNQTQVDIALDALKNKFDPQESSIFSIVASQIKRGRQTRDLSEIQEKLPIWEEKGIYKFKDPRGNISRLSNFTLILEDRIFHEESFNYKCTLLNSEGERTEEVMFDKKSRSNLNAFKEMIAGAGPYYFYGGPNELSYMWEFIDRNQTSEKTIYVQGVGWIKKQNMFLFGNGAIRNNKPYQANEKGLINVEGTNYKSFGVYVYGGELPEINFQDDYTPEFAAEVARNFQMLVDTAPTDQVDYKGLLFLGFLPAVLYSHYIVDYLRMFPFPFWYGTPGTGKSASIELMMNLIGYSGTAEPFAELTSPGFCQAMEQVSSLIYWTTEYKAEKFKHLEETFKSAYHRNPPGKGGVNKKRLNYILNGCNFIDSNQLPIESDAMMERIVTFSLFRKPEPGSRRDLAYNWLHEHKKKLSVITRQLVIDQTPDTVEELKKRINEYRTYLTMECRFDLRTAKNYAIPAAALHLIRGIQIPKDFKTWLGQFIANNREYNVKGDPVVNFFQRIRYLYIDKGILKNSIGFEKNYKVDDENRTGNFLYINLQSAFLEIQEDMGRKREEVTYSRNYIYDALKNSDAYVEHNVNRRIFGQQNKCMVLDIDYLNPVINSDLLIIRDAYHEKYCQDGWQDPATPETF